MINYTAHLKHYKKSFDDALEILKKVEKPTLNDKNKIDKINRALYFRNYFLSGKVYTYDYNALGKKRLPYYDRYPLVLVLAVYKRKHTFVGLNLHYLNVKQRELLTEMIIKRRYNLSTDRVYVKFISDTLRGLSKMIYNKCVKMYRMDRVIGLPREISPMLLEEINNVNDNTFINKNQNYVQAIPLSRYYR